MASIRSDGRIKRGIPIGIAPRFAYVVLVKLSQPQRLHDVLEAVPVGLVLETIFRVTVVVTRLAMPERGPHTAMSVYTGVFITPLGPLGPVLVAPAGQLLGGQGQRTRWVFRMVVVTLLGLDRPELQPAPAVGNVVFWIGAFTDHRVREGSQGFDTALLRFLPQPLVRGMFLHGPVLQNPLAALLFVFAVSLQGRDFHVTAVGVFIFAVHFQFPCAERPSSCGPSPAAAVARASGSVPGVEPHASSRSAR